MARLAGACLGILAATFVVSASCAENFPSRPVRLVVPYAPGGSVDLVGRILSQHLTDSLGQPVIVDNRPGAGGAIGVAAAAKSPPDGHTLVISGNGAITVNVHLRALTYDPQRDLVPVSMLTTVPIVVAVHPSLPVNSVKDLVTYAKARPGALSFSSNGPGSISYLAAELLKQMTGIDIVHVAYKGAAPGAAAVASGEVQLGFIDASAAEPFLKSGLVRVIAVTDSKRSTLQPDVPTIAESGFSGFDVSAWIALFAPSGTPSEIMSLLNGKVVHALTSPGVRERILKMQMEPAPTNAAEMDRIFRRETKQWSTIIQQSGIKSE